MLNLTSLRVSWRPPPLDAINGLLKGFLINIRSNQSASEDRNITTNERATSVTLYRLVSDASYTIRVAARTSAGVGAFFDCEPVLMSMCSYLSKLSHKRQNLDEETLKEHMNQFERSAEIWYKQPWIVLVIGIVLWCILLLMVAILWYRCCHRRQDLETKACDFIKIRDGSVSVLNTTNVRPPIEFWQGHENNFNGNTVETFSGGSGGILNGHMMGHSAACSGGNYSHHDQCSSADYGGSGKLPAPACCPITGQQFYGGHASCATLQRNMHSPSHHYHYAAVPDYQGQMYGINGINNTFHGNHNRRMHRQQEVFI